MKSRELLTTPVLIVTDYGIVPHKDGRFLQHQGSESNCFDGIEKHNAMKKRN